ncbi:MAG: 3-hydroxyacyl-CoA dehydrogenase family protein [Actinomycetota bacterium]|nr:3-hydroxyacyl-CoA dehydrogenase family protein [Actinomycetota bacterium]
MIDQGDAELKSEETGGDLMQPEEIRKVMVVGAGVMGHSIALVLACGGKEVSLVDVDREKLSHALKLMDRAFQVLGEAGRVDPHDKDTVLERVHPFTDLEEAARDCDLVIEAVTEVPEVKKEVFTRLDKCCPSDAVLTSNTSGLNIFEFVEVENPARLLITHWFNPPHVIPLVEVVPGPATDPRTVSLVMDFLRDLGKVPIALRGFTRAFIVNKIQNMMGLAVFELLGSGLVDPEDIDQAVKYSIGIRMPVIGVVQSLDFTGLDLVADIARSYGLNVPFIQDLVDKGRLGVKTSAGIYDYAGRDEMEILAKRDRLFLELMDRMEEMGTFRPV